MTLILGKEEGGSEQWCSQWFSFVFDTSVDQMYPECSLSNPNNQHLCMCVHNIDGMEVVEYDV